MHANAITLQNFYAAFARLDADTMAAENAAFLKKMGVET